MKIAKEKLENIIKQELQEVLNEQTQRTSTSSIYPKDQEQRQKLVDQLNAILNSIPDGPLKRAYFKTQRQKNREMGFNVEFLNQMLQIAKDTAKKVKAQQSKQGNTQQAQSQGGVNKILQSVTQRFKSAKPQAIKKIIELQAMLVQLGAAPAKLKSGKPFVDGIFGDSTMAAIKKLYR